MNWEYIAGFWDGEGWICSRHSRRKWLYWDIGCCQSTPQDNCLKEIQVFLYEEGIQSKIYIAKSNGPRRHPVSRLMIAGDRDNKIKFIDKLLVAGIIVKSKKPSRY